MTPRQDAGTLVGPLLSLAGVPGRRHDDRPGPPGPRRRAAWKAVLHRLLTLPRLRFTTSAPAAAAACRAAITSASLAPAAPLLPGVKTA
jgi:hypothetical protein